MNKRQSGFQMLATATGAQRARAEMRQMQQEANERGISVLRVEQEHLEAEWERRQADAARVQALINDPATLRRWRRVWAGEPMEPEPEEAAPRDPNAPPSSGKSISPPRR
jgi:hypothetical protein